MAQLVNTFLRHSKKSCMEDRLMYDKVVEMCVARDVQIEVDEALHKLIARGMNLAKQKHMRGQFATLDRARQQYEKQATAF